MTTIARARARAEVGERLTLEDALALYEENDLLFLAACARAAKERASGRSVFYTVNRHINLTNICSSNCPLCAFQVEKGDARGYVLSLEDLDQRLAAAAKVPELSEIHIVSALHPEEPFSYYVDVVRAVRAALPGVEIQAFTPVEIVNFAKMTARPVKSILEELQAAWLETMRAAQALGIRTNASMMYGHVETVRERIEHLLAIRDLQDETGGFQAFLLFPFHPAHTKLGEERQLTRVGAWEDLKMMALSRLVLDNVPHMKAFWVMLTLPIAQLALGFGADDLDGTIGEEKIIHAAGAQTGTGITKARLAAMIREAGYEPVERDARYERIGKAGETA